MLNNKHTYVCKTQTWLMDALFLVYLFVNEKKTRKIVLEMSNGNYYVPYPCQIVKCCWPGVYFGTTPW